MRVYWRLLPYAARGHAPRAWRLSCNCLARAAILSRPQRGLRSSCPIHFPPTFHRSFSQRLRSWFFTGLIVFGPIAVTAYIAWWVVDTIDNWVRPWLPNILSPDAYLPFHVPGFGVVIAIVGLTLLGFLTANFIGRSLVQIRRGDARSHAAHSRRPQGPEAGVRNHLQPVRQPIPQGRAGRVSGSRAAGRSSSSPRPRPRSSPAPCRRRSR